MHNIYHWTYAYNTDFKKINEEISRQAERDGDGFYFGGAHFRDTIPFNSYEEAYEYIDNIDKPYLNIAVPYIDSRNCNPSKKLENLENKYNELNKKYKKEDSKICTKDFKSKYFGCKNCGSKLAVKFLNSNICPLCQEDLRSKTQLEKISRYKENLETAGKALKAQQKIEDIKNVKKGKKMWLVKFEYHS